MKPIRVTALMDGGMTTSGPPIALDALLAKVVADSMGLVAGFGPMVPIEIPIAREPDGRFHFASFAIVGGWDAHERRYVNRKFPIAEAQQFGDAKLRRVHIGAGAQKSYRIPHEVAFARDDRIEWYAIGKEDEVRDLLAWVTHLGRRRAVGRGKVREWRVEPCESWGDGFPVVRGGAALRTLPSDWPGLVEPAVAHAVLTFPYWEHAREELCAVATIP